jgi:hypothetical protein
MLGSIRNTCWRDIKGCWAIVRKFWKKLKKNWAMGDTKTMSKDNEGIDKTLRDNKSIGKTLGNNQKTLNNIRRALNNDGKTSKHNKNKIKISLTQNNWGKCF